MCVHYNAFFSSRQPWYIYISSMHPKAYVTCISIPQKSDWIIFGSYLAVYWRIFCVCVCVLYSSTTCNVLTVVCTTSTTTLLYSNLHWLKRLMKIVNFYIVKTFIIKQKLVKWTLLYISCMLLCWYFKINQLFGTNLHQTYVMQQRALKYFISPYYSILTPFE